MFSGLAFGFEVPCEKETEKYEHYLDKSDKWEFRLAYCIALQDEDEYKSCYTEKKKAKYYKGKVEKWAERLEICERIANP